MTTTPGPGSLLLRGGRVTTCAGPTQGSPTERLAILDDGAVLIEGEVIRWVGPSDEAPRDADVVLELEGRAVLPGLVDPHTHLLFAGSRVDEMARRRAGVDYRTIAAEGGGIASTVRATREASDDELLEGAARRLEAELRHGVTTVEVKTGYGGAVDGELRLLTLLEELERRTRQRLVPTLLAAHALPDEYRDDRDAFVRAVVEEAIPRGAGHAHAADVYCDVGAFTLEETRTILEAARDAGLALKAHVGQFEDLGGPELLAELGALSADHLEQASDAGVGAMGQAGVRAVLLPGAWCTLGQRPPDVERLRRAGVRVAVGTDLNPGTSPCTDLPLCASLAVREAGLTLEEALLSITVEAAAALGVDRGRLVPGLPADLAIYDEEDPRALAYALGGARAASVYVAGREVHASSSVARIW